MSSSKFFKTDPLFIPIPLVRCTIASPAVTEDRPVSADPYPLEPETEIKEAQSDRQPEAQPQSPVDVEAIREEAYHQGMADQAAQDHADFLTVCQSLADACQKLDSERKKLLHQSRGEIVNLIITLSRKVIGRELNTPRNIIAATLESALEQSIASEEFYVSLHPDDLAFAEEKAPEIIAAIRGLERLVFKTDDAITRGGCLVESKVCLVDATIETQLENLQDLLEEQADILPHTEEE
jgi:flagellar assembly protein FliH